MTKNIPIPPLALDFEKAVYQASAQKYVRTQHRSKEVVSSNGNIVFEFTLNHNEFLSLDESTLCVRGHIKDTGSETTKDWSKIYPINYLLHSMYKQVQIEIDNENITPLSQGYMYEAFLEALLTFSQPAKKSILSVGLWLPKKDDRVAVVAAGREFEMVGKLHTDLAHQPKAIPGGCSVRITLVRNKPEFYMMSDCNKHFPSFETDDVYFESHKILVIDAYEKDLNNLMKKKSITYNHTSKRLKTISVQDNVTDTILENVFTGQMPSMILFCMVKAAAFNGDYKLDPYDFQPFGLNFFQCIVDGIPFPSRPFTPNFSKGLCGREYYALFQALGQNGTDPYSNISFSDFQKDRMIIAQNFTASLSHGYDGLSVLDSPKNGSMQIYLRFDKPLAEPIKVIIYAEFDRCMEMDINRKVRG